MTHQTTDAALEQENRLLRQRIAELEQANQHLQADLAAYQQTETAWSQAAQFKQAILDTLPVELAVLDATGTIIAVNQAWRAFATSYSPIPIKTTEGANYLHVCEAATGAEAEDAWDFAAGLRAVLAGECETFDQEYTCHTPEHDSWFLGRILRLTHNNQTYVVVIHKDITQLKQTETALHASESRFRHLIEAVPVAIALRQGIQFVYLNAAAEALAGYTLAELQDQGFWQLLHPDSHAVMQARQLAQQRGEPLAPRYEIKASTREGGIRWLDVTSVEMDLGGEATSLDIALDITERKQAEAAREREYIQMQATNQYLRYTSDLLRTIFNNIQDGLLLLDAQGIVLAANRALITLLACTPRNILQRPWQGFCQPDEADPASSIGLFPGLPALETLHDGHPRWWRGTFMLKGGASHTLDMHAVPIGSTSDTSAPPQPVKQVLLHIADMTRQLQIEALTLENERLNLGRKLMEIVTHEVNTPLQVVLFALELIPHASTEELDYFVFLVRKEISHIGTVLHELEETYDADIDEHSFVDVNHLVDQALFLVGGRLEKCHIRVDQQFTTPLPLVPAFGHQLEQVLLNLVFNAIEGMPNGGELLFRTTLHTSEPTAPDDSAVTYIRIEVISNSLTNPNKPLAHTLEPFFTTRKPETGLGLLVMQRVVAKHGGMLHVKHHPHAGTTFTISLPISRGTEPYA